MINQKQNTSTVQETVEQFDIDDIAITARYDCGYLSTHMNILQSYEVLIFF